MLSLKSLISHLYFSFVILNLIALEAASNSFENKTLSNVNYNLENRRDTINEFHSKSSEMKVEKEEKKDSAYIPRNYFPLNSDKAVTQGYLQGVETPVVNLLKRRRRKSESENDLVHCRLKGSRGKIFKNRCARSKSSRSSEPKIENVAKPATVKVVKWKNPSLKQNAGINGINGKVGTDKTSKVEHRKHFIVNNTRLHGKNKGKNYNKIHEVDKSSKLPKKYTNRQPFAYRKKIKAGKNKVTSKLKGEKYLEGQDTNPRNQDNTNLPKTTFNKSKLRKNMHSPVKNINALKKQKLMKEHKKIPATEKNEKNFESKNNELQKREKNRTEEVIRGNNENGSSNNKSEYFQISKKKQKHNKNNSSEDTKGNEGTRKHSFIKKPKNMKANLKQIHNNSLRKDKEKAFENTNGNKSLLNKLKVKKTVQLRQNIPAKSREVIKTLTGYEKHHYLKGMKRNMKLKKDNLLYEVKDFIVKQFPKKRSQQIINSQSTHKKMARDTRNSNTASKNISQNSSKTSVDESAFESENEGSQILDEIKDFVVKNFHSERLRRSSSKTLNKPIPFSSAHTSNTGHRDSSLRDTKRMNNFDDMASSRIVDEDSNITLTSLEEIGKITLSDYDDATHLTNIPKRDVSAYDVNITEDLTFVEKDLTTEEEGNGVSSDSDSSSHQYIDYAQQHITTDYTSTIQTNSEPKIERNVDYLIATENSSELEEFNSVAETTGLYSASISSSPSLSVLFGENISEKETSDLYSVSSVNNNSNYGLQSEKFTKSVSLSDDLNVNQAATVTLNESIYSDSTSNSVQSSEVSVSEVLYDEMMSSSENSTVKLNTFSPTSNEIKHSAVEQSSNKNAKRDSITFTHAFSNVSNSTEHSSIFFSSTWSSSIPAHNSHSNNLKTEAPNITKSSTFSISSEENKKYDKESSTLTSVSFSTYTETQSEVAEDESPLSTSSSILSTRTEFINSNDSRKHQARFKAKVSKVSRDVQKVEGYNYDYQIPSKDRSLLDTHRKLEEPGKFVSITEKAGLTEESTTSFDTETTAFQQKMLHGVNKNSPENLQYENEYPDGDYSDSTFLNIKTTSESVEDSGENHTDSKMFRQNLESFEKPNNQIHNTVEYSNTDDLNSLVITSTTEIGSTIAGNDFSQEENENSFKYYDKTNVEEYEYLPETTSQYSSTTAINKEMRSPDKENQKMISQEVEENDELFNNGSYFTTILIIGKLSDLSSTVENSPSSFNAAKWKYQSGSQDNKVKNKQGSSQVTDEENIEYELVSSTSKPLVISEAHSNLKDNVKDVKETHHERNASNHRLLASSNRNNVRVMALFPGVKSSKPKTVTFTTPVTITEKNNSEEELEGTESGEFTNEPVRGRQFSNNHFRMTTYPSVTRNLKKIHSQLGQISRQQKSTTERGLSSGTYFVTLQNSKIMPDEPETSEDTYSDIIPKSRKAVSKFEHINDLSEEYYDEIAQGSIRTSVSENDDIESSNDHANAKVTKEGLEYSSSNKNKMLSLEKNSFVSENIDISTDSSLASEEQSTSDDEEIDYEAEHLTTPETIREHARKESNRKDKKLVDNINSLILRLKHRRNDKFKDMNYKNIRKVRSILSTKPTFMPKVTKTEMSSLNKWLIAVVGFIIISSIIIIGLCCIVPKRLKKSQGHNENIPVGLQEITFDGGVNISDHLETDDEMNNLLDNDIDNLQYHIDQVMLKNEISEDRSMKKQYSATDHLLKIHAAIAGTID